MGHAERFDLTTGDGARDQRCAELKRDVEYWLSRGSGCGSALLAMSATRPSHSRRPQCVRAGYLTNRTSSLGPSTAAAEADTGVVVSRGAPRSRLSQARLIQPMLATPGDLPPVGEDDR